MSPVQYLCGQCHGTSFPQGMYINYCAVCQAYIHPGCWDVHVAHHHKQEEIASTHLEPRQGKISAYGIIQWNN